jgi:hypothetical protein
MALNAFFEMLIILSMGQWAKDLHVQGTAKCENPRAGPKRPHITRLRD